MDSPFFWLALTLLCILVHAFFTMQEMAFVSFDKVRLEWYIATGVRRASWIKSLLDNPSRLFGTTLLGVNVAVQIGSECSRRFYESIGLPPSISPITQVCLVMIVAELSPMFAARRYPVHTAMLGSPLIYACSKILFPFVWLMELLSKVINRLISGKKKHRELFMSREELQRVLEDQDEEIQPDSKDVSHIVGNIFSLRTKTAAHVMEPLATMQIIPSACTIGRMRRLLAHAYYPHVPIYHGSPNNIVAMAFPRDVLRFPDNHRVRAHAQPPWFITEDTPVIKILKQIRGNNQSVAIVVDSKGHTVGMITLDDLVSEVFGEMDESLRVNSTAREKVIERTFSADLSIAEFNKKFKATLDGKSSDTLSDLIIHKLGHHPEKGESVRVGDFELRAEESTLLGVKKISVRTIV